MKIVGKWVRKNWITPPRVKENPFIFNSSALSLAWCRNLHYLSKKTRFKVNANACVALFIIFERHPP